jgi:hypothetical protein
MGIDDSNLHELDPKEEKSLRKMLQKHLKDLENCNSQMKGLSSNERKKLRNRKASRVSRLRKKLSVYDLTRRYNTMADESKEREKVLKLHRVALELAVKQLRTHEPRYQCALLQKPLPVVTPSKRAGKSAR